MMLSLCLFSSWGSKSNVTNDTINKQQEQKHFYTELHFIVYNSAFLYITSFVLQIL